MTYITHNQSRCNNGKGSRTYKTWMSMRSRCKHESHPAYPNYGGRGITVCERWMSFENFLSDMGDRPENMTLDRINVNGNYEPENCRWATLSDQQANRRDSKIIEAFGKLRTASQWSLVVGICADTITRRIAKGVDPEIALTMKPFKGKLLESRTALAKVKDSGK